MYINFGMLNIVASRATFDMNGAYHITFPVQSKREGHIGDIHFINDKDGNGYIEWCKGNVVSGYGEKISLEELFSWLEERKGVSGD